MIQMLAALPSMGEVIWRLLGGWWTFVSVNVARFTPDPDLWIPSAMAFAICVATFHFLARKWKVPRPFSAALSIALILPVLFATAFLVPGIILQLRLLLERR